MPWAVKYRGKRNDTLHMHPHAFNMTVVKGRKSGACRVSDRASPVGVHAARTGLCLGLGAGTREGLPNHPYEMLQWCYCVHWLCIDWMGCTGWLGEAHAHSPRGMDDGIPQKDLLGPCPKSI